MVRAIRALLICTGNEVLNLEEIRLDVVNPTIERDFFIETFTK